MTVDNRAERWHVGKEIPLAVLMYLVGQTAGLIWFAATQTAKLDNLTTLMASFSASQYTQADARRDAEVYLGRSSNNARRIDEVVRRVEVLENRRIP